MLIIRLKKYYNYVTKIKQGIFFTGVLWCPRGLGRYFSATARKVRGSNPGAGNKLFLLNFLSHSYSPWTSDLLSKSNGSVGVRQEG